MEGKRAMRGGHRGGVKTLPVCGAATGEFVAVIASNAIAEMPSVVSRLRKDRQQGKRQQRYAISLFHGPLHRFAKLIAEHEERQSAYRYGAPILGRGDGCR
jgi:hypothetical protein